MAESKFDMELTKLEKDLAALKKRKAKMRVLCSHTNKNGKLTVETVSRQDGLYQCTKCGEAFHLDLIKHDEVNAAVAVMHDVLNQIKCLADTDENNQVDKAIVQTVGELLFNLKESVELYDKMVLSNGKDKKKKKKNKNKHREESTGSYGMGSLSSFGGGRSKY